ncbi:MAG: hypothetical protein ACRDRX_15210 [Pseudonocardiaceae bacterium]
MAAVIWAWQSRYRRPERKVICWLGWLVSAVALIIGAAFIVCVVPWTGEFPIKEGWEAVTFVGLFAMAATIAPLLWIPDRKHPKAKFVQLALVGLAGGIIAALVMYLCGYLPQGERARLSLLTVYGPLAAESLLLTNFFPEVESASA